MADDVVTCHIISSKEKRELSVLWVEIEAPNGSFLIGPGHSPLVSLLKVGGRLAYKTADSLEVEIDVFE